MKDLIDEIISHHKNKNLISILKEVQDYRIQLSKPVMQDIARKLNVSFNDVYEIATFYSFLSIEPLGKHIIRICKSTPCYLKNCDVIVKAIEQELGIVPGQVTDDGKFSLKLTNCIGACDRSPAMMIDKEIYGDLDPDKVKRILSTYE